MGKLGNIEHQFDIDGTTITFQGGKLAQLAAGSVVASIGDTTLMTTMAASSQPKDFLGFFPLTIEVEERMYAAGQIPGSFFKREGRPSEGAILVCRLTDRPLRPTFADGLRNEIQIVNTVLQTTKVDPYDVLAINASSVATMLGGVPFDGPVAAVRYAMMRDGSWKAFPTYEELETEVVFNLVAAGRVMDDDVAILMVEAEATPGSVEMIEMGAPKPTEEVIGQALQDLKPLLRQLCEAQQAFVDMVGAKPLGDFQLFPNYTEPVYALVEGHALAGVEAIFGETTLGKEARGEKLAVVKSAAIDHAVATGVEGLEEEAIRKQASESFRSVEKKVVRKMITEKGLRIDGRGPADIRPLEAEVGLLPMTHGSAFFQRGETNVMSVLALGTLREAQRLDTLDPITEKTYMHHYNFAPYSTGETGRVGSPKRREIGHGLLAERALKPVLPQGDDWPYTMRIVSDITSSNGSTSMASVCGSTLALMDGGVPITAPVAGIAMGLIKEGDTYTTLTDIQGTEDFYGDMDFKVAGTPDFVTALQLDTKLSGVPADVLQKALLQAKDARVEILAVMTATIAEPREEVADSAPQAFTVYIPMDKIGEVIGPKGKIIREITEETGADINIDDDGSRGIVQVYATSKASANAAMDKINAIANPILPEAGERYHAAVVKTESFGAFVTLTPGTDGLLHISKLSQIVGKRLNHAEEAVNVGDKIWVEVLEVLDGGRKFKLDYVTEDGQLGGDVNPERGGSGGGDRGGNRGGGDRGGNRGGGDRNRGGRDGNRGGGDRNRGGRDGGGDRKREDAPKADAPKADTGSSEGGEARTRTRTRSRDRD